MADFIDEAMASCELTMEQTLKQENLYACSLKSCHSTMTRDIEMEAGCAPPSLGNILYYYAERAQDISYYDDILEWADEMEYDLSDPKTIPKYKQLVSDKTELRLLLGEENYQGMMAGFEISQAIAMAAGPGNISRS